MPGKQKAWFRTRSLRRDRFDLGPHACFVPVELPADERRRPVVSVHDAASHSLAWVGSALGTRQYNLGVDRFGESGTIEDLHEIVGISAGNIVNAASLREELLHRGFGLTATSDTEVIALMLAAAGGRTWQERLERTLPA